jgi:hypothetical protein
MSKIWFFGDSFAANNHFLKAKSWTKTVQEAFPEYDSENLALGASSLDYLYYTYEQKRKEFKSGDIVIMSLTNIERLFLRKLYEDLYFRFLQTGRITSPLAPKGKLLEHLPEDHPWYTYFADDLFNPEAHKANVNLFLNSLQYDAMTKGIKIIALPIAHFPFLDEEDKDHITLGRTLRGHNLAAVSNKQMKTKFNHIKSLFFQHEECRTYDNTLANHLTPRNNEILANKVIRNIKTDEPIDLSTEWEY